VSAALTAACPACGALNRVPPERLAEQPRCGRCSQPLFAAAPVALDAAGWQAHVVRATLPVLVDVWAPWCGPCLSMAPQFERAAAELEPQLRLAKLDSQAEPGLAGALGIRSIPTLVLFDRGRERARQSGAMASADIVRWARQHL
jgi:thioredoxin 2